MIVSSTNIEASIRTRDIQVNKFNNELFSLKKLQLAVKAEIWGQSIDLQTKESL